MLFMLPIKGTTKSACSYQTNEARMSTLHCRKHTAARVRVTHARLDVLEIWLRVRPIYSLQLLLLHDLALVDAFEDNVHLGAGR